MNNQITDELQSFLKDYAADPTPRDFAIAQHFYDLALEDVKKEVEKKKKRSKEAKEDYGDAGYSILVEREIARTESFNRLLYFIDKLMDIPAEI